VRSPPNVSSPGSAEQIGRRPAIVPIPRQINRSSSFVGRSSSGFSGVEGGASWDAGFGTFVECAERGTDTGTIAGAAASQA